MLTALPIAAGRTLALAVPLVLMACAPGSGESSRADDGGQTIRIGVAADRYLTELPSRPDLGKYPLNAGVFDTLTRMDERFGVEPMLAETWTYDRGRNAYRFTLRRGVRFHDGAELTAEDVTFTFDTIVRVYPHNYEELGPDSIRAIDRYTVEIVPEEPNARLAEQIAHPIWGVNRAGSDPMRPVGTGPFRFVEYVRHDRIAVERFDGYWNTAVGRRAEALVWRFVTDPQARLLALRAGQLDLVGEVPRPLLAALDTPGTGVTVIRSDIGYFDALTFNIRGDAPYVLGKDRAIREAVGLAVDRAALAHAVWRGAGEPSTTWIPPQVLGPYSSMVTAPRHDPAGAGELLEKTGWRLGADGIRHKEGRRLRLSHVVTFPTSEHREAAELVQQQLRRVGIETVIELMPDAAVSGARRRNGQFDLLHFTGNQNEPYPCFLPDLQYYSKSTAAPTRFVAPGGKTDDAIEACREAEDIDAARRHAAEAIHQLVDVERIIVPLAGLRRVWVAGPGVTGFRPHPSDTNQRWDGLHLAR